MPLNAAGLDVSGNKNPRWKGGPVNKKCAICGKEYSVKYTYRNSKYCSLQCVGISQRGVSRKEAIRVGIECAVCGELFYVYKSRVSRLKCCSTKCSRKYRSIISSGENNPSWNGGTSGKPYPWFFRRKSKEIMARDGWQCQNPTCKGTDARLTVHHINYEKTDCSDENLITLCSACNSSANFNRDEWQAFYSNMRTIEAAS